MSWCCCCCRWRRRHFFCCVPSNYAPWIHAHIIKTKDATRSVVPKYCPHHRPLQNTSSKWLYRLSRLQKAKRSDSHTNNLIDFISYKFHCWRNYVHSSVYGLYWWVELCQNFHDQFDIVAIRAMFFFFIETKKHCLDYNRSIEFDTKRNMFKCGSRGRGERRMREREEERMRDTDKERRGEKYWKNERLKTRKPNKSVCFHLFNIAQLAFVMLSFGYGMCVCVFLWSIIKISYFYFYSFSM